MADNNKRPSFPSLETANGSGAVLALVKEGDAPTNKNAQIAFSFKDDAGNAVLPKLSPEGAIYTDSTTAGDRLWERGKVPGSIPADLDNVVDGDYAEVLTVPLVNGGVYTNLSLVVSARRDSAFQLVLDDGTNSVVLLDAITGPGQYTVVVWSDHFNLEVPATGTFSVKVRGYNYEYEADLAATFACIAAV